MAQARIEIICTECGCKFTHRKSCWNRDDATRYEEWARDHITTCQECYVKQKRAEERAALDAKTAEANEAIEGMTLSELTGSEKQIAWATDIRARAAAACKKAGASEKLWELFNSKTDAKWWIDNRDAMDIGPRTIVKTLATR